MTRSISLLVGAAVLAGTFLALGFALWTGDLGVVRGVGKSAVLALAAGGIASACGGLVMASSSFSSRAWLLYGVAILLAGASLALTIAIGDPVSG